MAKLIAKDPGANRMMQFFFNFVGVDTALAEAATYPRSRSWRCCILLKLSAIRLAVDSPIPLFLLAFHQAQVDYCHGHQ